MFKKCNIFFSLQTSPIKKNRISDVLERGESESEDETDESPMETSVTDSPSQAANSSPAPPAAEDKSSADSRKTTTPVVTYNKDAGADKPTVFNKSDADKIDHIKAHEDPNEEANVRLENGFIKIDKVMECNADRRNSSGSKTVLISRNQSINFPSSEKSNCSCSKADKENRCNKCSNSNDLIISKPLRKESNKNSICEKPTVASIKTTPDVVIQPASPAVLAAHKRSVITVTLRQRSPSVSSTGTASHLASPSVSASQPVSRSPSSCSTASRASVTSAASRASAISSNKHHQHRKSASSVCSFSPETLASIITVNGVTIADNEQLSAEFASSLAVAVASSSTTNEAKNATDCSSSCDGLQDATAAISCCSSAMQPRTQSARNGHCNKTSSYVHVTCPTPTVSPRPRISNGKSTGQSCTNRSKASGSNKLSPNGYSSNNRLQHNSLDNGYSSQQSITTQCSTNGFYHCKSSVASKNSQNTARTSLDSVPCKDKCYDSSVISNNSGTLSCTCSTKNSSVSSKHLSDTVILRNSCVNFDKLDSSGCAGCSSGENKVARGAASYRVLCSGDRHSSGSLDTGSSSERHRMSNGSECLGCEEKLSAMSCDKSEYSRSYNHPSSSCYSSDSCSLKRNGECCGSDANTSVMPPMPESSV